MLTTHRKSFAIKLLRDIRCNSCFTYSLKTCQKRYCLNSNQAFVIVSIGAYLDTLGLNDVSFSKIMVELNKNVGIYLKHLPGLIDLGFIEAFSGAKGIRHKLTGKGKELYYLFIDTYYKRSKPISDKHNSNITRLRHKIAIDISEMQIGNVGAYNVMGLYVPVLIADYEKRKLGQYYLIRPLVPPNLVGSLVLPPFNEKWVKTSSVITKQ